MTFISAQIDTFLLAVPDGCAPVEIALGPCTMAAFLDDVTTDVILMGDDITIDRAYARDFPERLVWLEVATDWSGSTTRPAWDLNRDVLLHMRALKHERGISHYRGIPLRVGDAAISIRWETIDTLVSALRRAEVKA